MATNQKIEDKIENGAKKAMDDAADVSINVRMAENGSIVTVCSHSDKPDSYKDETYIYDNLDAALAAVPGLVKEVSKNG